jgi:transcriptional regulator with XRE-family HTH domain
MEKKVQSLKNGVNNILNKMNLTFADLAENTGFRIDEIERQLSSKDPDIMMLEKISKELRIPLYSFYRQQNNVDVQEQREPYYTNSLWEN